MTAEMVSGIGAMIALAATTVICLVVTHRAATGALPRNQVAGIRLRSTYSSEAAWRAGHRAARPVMWLLVPITVAADVAIVSAIRQVSPLAVGLIVMIWAAALLPVVVVAAVIAARHTQDGSS
ncbi:SdpI family protein [Mycobacterium sp. D16R24]|uniref:SdpI family protein n=1 Tax=Mycobacterium sp. D16R24 TaxID=1855656 RepID=UPI0009921A93|nr:SdpI family protein [Mycobacterium sp. D16R24]